MTNDEDRQPAHHPTLYATGRHGCWVSCICGWQVSGRFTTTQGAHLAYGAHLIAAEEQQ